MHYPGLLYLQDEECEAAKSQFEAGMVFGDATRNDEKFLELLKSGRQKAYLKPFVQGPLGKRNWRSGESDQTIDERTQISVKACQNNRRYKDYGSACKVANINGKSIK